MAQSGQGRRRLGLLLLPGAAALLVGALIAVPAQHSRGATSGTPLTWGNNEKGQLGDGTLNNRPDPEYVMGLSGITHVAGGGRHSLALREDGTVFAWGSNDRGQLGDGTTIDRSHPVQVQNLSNVVAIAAGGEFSVALESDGTVWTWGDDSYAQLGDGLDPSGRPDGTPDDCAGIMIDGACLNNVHFPDQGGVMPVTQPEQVPGLANVTRISAGQNYALALTKDGTVYGWGEDDHGELALGGDAFTTVKTVPLALPLPLPLPGNVTAISAGAHHGLALLSDTTVLGWGLDDAGQLGNAAGVDGACTCRVDPAQVLDQGGNPLYGIRAVSAGGQHSLAIRDADGAVYAWGDNSAGQLGDGTTTGRETPKEVQGLSGIIEIAAGGHHSLAIGGLQLTVDGQKQVMTVAYGWGLNSSGQAGTHQYDDQLCECRKLAATVTGGNFTDDVLRNITHIAAGDIHSLAIASASLTSLDHQLSSLHYFPNGGTSNSCQPGACPPGCTSDCGPTVTPCPTTPSLTLIEGENSYQHFDPVDPCSNTNPCTTPVVLVTDSKMMSVESAAPQSFAPVCPSPTTTATPNPCPSPTTPGCGNPNTPCVNGFTAAGLPCNTPTPSPSPTPCVPAGGVPGIAAFANQCTPTPTATPTCLPAFVAPGCAPNVPPPTAQPAPPPCVPAPRKPC